MFGNVGQEENAGEYTAESNKNGIYTNTGFSFWYLTLQFTVLKVFYTKNFNFFFFLRGRNNTQNTLKATNSPPFCV